MGAKRICPSTAGNGGCGAVVWGVVAVVVGMLKLRAMMMQKRIWDGVMGFIEEEPSTCI